MSLDLREVVASLELPVNLVSQVLQVQRDWLVHWDPPVPRGHEGRLDPLAHRGQEGTLAPLGPLECQGYLVPLETPVRLERAVLVEILESLVHLEEQEILDQAGLPDQSEFPELPVFLERLGHQVLEDRQEVLVRLDRRADLGFQVQMAKWVMRDCLARLE